jgi:hypothetical protein
MSQRAALWLASLSALGCTSPPPSEPAPPPTETPAPPPEPALTTPPVEHASPSDAHIRFEPAPDGDLVPIVQAHATRARAEGRTPLLYVGATWCEPCRYFHEAAERGDLDGELPPLSLLELDLDRDGDRIAAAGYGSRMIPLFAVPGDDGRGTDRRIEGSIHGPGSPAQIVPRLLAILPR